MPRITYPVIVAFAMLISGCRPQNHEPQQSDYDRVSEEIERIREQAAKTPAQVPAAAQNIRVVVNLLTVSAADYSDIDALFEYVDRNVTAATQPAAFGASGLVVGLASENFRLRLRAAARRMQSFEDTELFIVLADGATGYISLGTQIAVTRFHYSGRWYSYTDYDFRRAGRSLEVAARTRPDGLIEMQLTPLFSNFLNGGGDLVLTELTTTITATPGQTVVIGGAEAQQDSAASALLSYERSGRRTRTIVTVTPYLK